MWKLCYTIARFGMLTSLLAGLPYAYGENSTYFNPILPGWNSDPSCVHVNGTYFCATSSFLTFPGNPIYASKDLINWKLASHAWTRPDQFGPVDASRNVSFQVAGFFAPNLRYHDGMFYLTNVYVGPAPRQYIAGTIFKTADIFDVEGWSDAVIYEAQDVDPDLFWDDDGSTYIVSAHSTLQTIDLETGETSEPITLWNGTGGASPEGPHMYKKDGWYYLLIAEGGTELGHRASIARSKNLTGPWEENPANPFLTNAGTDELFQTVGHADLFQDEAGNWWGMALSTRSGPAWEIYPMGRESVLFPVTWKEGEWPFASPVRGVMSGWELPATNLDVPGVGPFVEEPDVIDFTKGSQLAGHLLHWRYPDTDKLEISPAAHPNSLLVKPSRANLTGDWTSDSPDLTGATGLSFLARRQSHTMFSYSVDVLFDPERPGQEAGVSLFLTQWNHVDLGIIQSNANHSSAGAALEFQFRTQTSDLGSPSSHSETQITLVPASWKDCGPIRLQIDSLNSTHYMFSAHRADNPNSKLVIGIASGEAVSGGSGPFVGVLLGIYATCNGAGAEGKECPPGGNAYFSRWRYTGVAQQIDETNYLPAEMWQG